MPLLGYAVGDQGEGGGFGVGCCGESGFRGGGEGLGIGDVDGLRDGVG